MLFTALCYRWCKLLRVGKVSSVVVMVMDSVSCREVEQYADCFPHLRSQFDMASDEASSSRCVCPPPTCTVSERLMASSIWTVCTCMCVCLSVFPSMLKFIITIASFTYKVLSFHYFIHIEGGLSEH
jgi:hypothetical protein